MTPSSKAALALPAELEAELAGLQALGFAERVRAGFHCGRTTPQS
jgi:hypothetical protein